jgi:hypothetical protein
MEDLGDSPGAANLVVSSQPLPEIECAQPINSGPQHFVLNAALASLDEWIRRGNPPPTAPRLETSGWLLARILRDEHGNALGGIRTPQVEVPISAFSGEPQGGDLFCILFGSTAPFDEAQLSLLYPDHTSYVSAFNGATDRAVQEGFILPPDAELMKAAAAASGIGS